MQNVGLILLVFAFVFAVIAAVMFESQGRWNFGWAAIAFYIAAQLIGGLKGVFG